MKKTIFAFVLIVALAVLLAGQEVVIQDTTPFTYAYMECGGSYQQIPARIGVFMQEFFKQKLMPAGNFFGMYLNSPAEVKEEELQWRLGFPVAADAAVAAPLLKGECQATKIAVYLYVGPYEKVGDAYGKILAYIEQNGYKPAGPTMEKYLDMDPTAVKPEELRTEINIPVEKK
ncbi:MAG: GyrI-like domain-containing protein [Candidatus Aminicenantes bacterium]|nr:GyrI-like domain-containing protein [Candidatus Aminicenantes bacterium]